MLVVLVLLIVVLQIVSPLEHLLTNEKPLNMPAEMSPRSQGAIWRGWVNTHHECGKQERAHSRWGLSAHTSDQGLRTRPMQ
jgi:hypothetical protein